jgi:hypothetical protein
MLGGALFKTAARADKALAQEHARRRRLRRSPRVIWLDPPVQRVPEKLRGANYFVGQSNGSPAR